MTAQGYIDPDYVDVAERIRLFYDRYPDGRIVTLGKPELVECEYDFERYWTDKNGERHTYPVKGRQAFVWVQAAAYRTVEDLHPARGTAWEPIPGPTPYTRESELMNAETSAWGRAIVAAGIPSKKIASADEIQARAPAGAPADGPGQQRTAAQNKRLHALLNKLDKNGPPADHESWKDYAHAWTVDKYGKHSSADLTVTECGELLAHLEALAVPFG